MEMKNIFKVFCVMALCIFGGVAHAEDGFWDTIASRPDVKITTSKNSKGLDLRTATFSGGVVISEQEGGATLSVDNSGHGAVLCTWEILIAVKSWLEMCPSDDKDFEKNINNAIEQINNFIITNSLSPVTKDEIDRTIKAKVTSFPKSEADLKRQCKTGDIANIVNNMKSVSPEKFKSGLDTFLSVPRPPVMNPCF